MQLSTNGKATMEQGKRPGKLLTHRYFPVSHKHRTSFLFCRHPEKFYQSDSEYVQLHGKIVDFGVMQQSTA